MSLTDLLFAPEAKPFAIALCLVLLIVALELASLLIGVTASSALDNLLPDLDLDNAELSAASRILSFMQFGQVPALIWLVLWLAGFGLCGLLLQQGSLTLTERFLPLGWVAAPLALVMTLPLVRILASWLGRWVFRETTEAIELDDLSGRPAVITVGIARLGEPAQARVTDKFGTTHYMMVEPVTERDCFQQGEQVILARRKETTWLVMSERDWKNLESAAWQSLGGAL